MVKSKKQPITELLLFLPNVLVCLHKEHWDIEQSHTDACTASLLLSPRLVQANQKEDPAIPHAYSTREARIDAYSYNSPTSTWQSHPQIDLDERSQTHFRPSSIPRDV